MLNSKSKAFFDLAKQTYLFFFPPSICSTRYLVEVRIFDRRYSLQLVLLPKLGLLLHLENLEIGLVFAFLSEKLENDVLLHSTL